MIPEVDVHMQESYKNWAQVLGSYPLVIIPPGHQVSKDTEILALKCGFRIVSGEYNSILKEELIIRNDKIPSLFLEWCEPDVEQIQSGYPIVRLMHDYDLIKNGVHWLEDKITEWEKAGIKRFISFKELVGYLFAEIRGHLNNDNITLGIDISKTGDQSIRHFSNHETTISIKVPHNALVSKVEVNNEESSAYTFDSGNKSGLTRRSRGMRHNADAPLSFPVYDLR